MWRVKASVVLEVLALKAVTLKLGEWLHQTARPSGSQASGRGTELEGNIRDHPHGASGEFIYILHIHIYTECVCAYIYTYILIDQVLQVLNLLMEIILALIKLNKVGHK